MPSLLALSLGFVGTVTLALWIALTAEQRERARRTLTVLPEFAYVELAYEPFIVSMPRVLRYAVRSPAGYTALAVVALYLMLTGRRPTSLWSDEELAETEREAWRRAVERISHDENRGPKGD